MNKIEKVFQYGQHRVVLETGVMARQASAAVKISMGETVLLVTVVTQPSSAGQDFFPLTVHYQEKTYAAGKIPGGYFKREGRPTEKETLISRLIDRPVRPLFPKGFVDEIQLIATVLSVDSAVQTDIPAILGASAALCLAGVPFQGPLGAARVGFWNNTYHLNPSLAEIETSALDLVVAGTDTAVLMVESEAHELSEATMLDAVWYGHAQMQTAIQAIHEFVEMAQGGQTSGQWEPPLTNELLRKLVTERISPTLREAYAIREKARRQDQIQTIRDQLLSTLCHEHTHEHTHEHGAHESCWTEAEVSAVFHDLESDIVRHQILAGEPRIDGRDTKTVRPIAVEIDVLPRTHGSALFTRGETQALVVVTLGTERDAQMIDDLEGDRKDDFLFHYNFPPFSVGETGPMSGPKRREIGHGRLAKRAVAPLMPKLTEFPYVVRVVSEILESNGSSSMASVCGSSLALMSAGVPLRAPVAGIAMGLIKDGDQYAVLTDILGDEDHLGDMDFKVAGSASGITALQMDIKITGITREIMQQALHQAKEGRLHILNIMNKVISAPTIEVSTRAPRLIMMKINPDKIRDVIGKGGATIRELTEATKCTIDITDDGMIKIAAQNIENGQEAQRRIEAITSDVEIGKTYEGTVHKILDFGAVVQFLSNRQGLLHISQIAQERVENVRDYLQEGQVIRVKVIELDRQGKIRLSLKQAEVVRQQG